MHIGNTGINHYYGPPRWRWVWVPDAPSYPTYLPPAPAYPYWSTLPHGTTTYC